MLLHAHRIEVIKGKFANALNQDGEFTAKEECLRFEINLFVDSRSGEDIVADAYVIGEDALKLGSLGRRAQDFVLLEGLEVVDVEITHHRLISRPGIDHRSSCNRLLAFLRLAAW